LDVAYAHLLEKAAGERGNIIDSANPYDNPDKYMLRKQLIHVVDKLPSINRKVITYHYFSDLTFKDVANILDLSKARVSQLHAESLALLRNTYENGYEKVV
jgi:RNA polymerase sigma factor (sigma-70 family)